MRIAPPHLLYVFSSLSLLLALVYAPAILINWYQSVGVRGVCDARVRASWSRQELESRGYGELVELVWSGEIVSVWVYQVYV